MLGWLDKLMKKKRVCGGVKTCSPKSPMLKTIDGWSPKLSSMPTWRQRNPMGQEAPLTTVTLTHHSGWALPTCVQIPTTLPLAWGLRSQSKCKTLRPLVVTPRPPTEDSVLGPCPQLLLNFACRVCFVSWSFLRWEWTEVQGSGAGYRTKMLTSIRIKGEHKPKISTAPWPSESSRRENRTCSGNCISRHHSGEFV